LNHTITLARAYHFAAQASEGEQVAFSAWDYAEARSHELATAGTGSPSGDANFR
jgi:hypothetical protein